MPEGGVDVGAGGVRFGYGMGKGFLESRPALLHVLEMRVGEGSVGIFCRVLLCTEHFG